MKKEDGLVHEKELKTVNDMPEPVISMTQDEVDAHNEKCAKAMEYKTEILGNSVRVYWMPDGGGCEVKDMRFHDSYDWVMLLVIKCDPVLLHRHIFINTEAITVFSWFTSASPLEISQVCLKVLND